MKNLVKKFLFRLLLITIAGLVIIQEASSTATGCPKDLPNTTEMKRFGDICYQFVSEEKYWYDARRYCLQNGGRLVKIGDSRTNSFIVETLNSLWWTNKGVWIGLHDTYREMQFQWTGFRIHENEAAGSWTNWGRGHPGAFLHSLRDCVRMVREDGQWKWHETPCNTMKWHYRFICEYRAPAYQPGAQLSLREYKPTADNRMLGKSTRSPRSTATPANSPSSAQTTDMPTAEQTSEIAFFETTQRQFDDLTDEETHQALNGFTTPGVDTDESTASFRTDFTEEEIDEAAVAFEISFGEEESETLDDTNGSNVRMAISLGLALVATCAILLAACIIYRRRQQKPVIATDAGNDKEDKENKIAKQNPCSEPRRAIANIYVVTGPLPSFDAHDATTEAEPPATWAIDQLPSFDDETPPFGLHQANRSTDNCGKEETVCRCPVAEISDLYAEIADEDEETTEAMEDEHIYESLEDCVA